jgi:hypothetical protein
MLMARQLIEFCELPAQLGVRLETGYRHDLACEGRAVFDEERLGGKEIRYSLSALWDETLPLLFGIGLNPSTARADEGDKTVDRAIRETRSAQRYGGLFWINLAAQMETNASVFIDEGGAEGRLNAEQVRIVLERLHPEETQRDIVLAWGSDGPKLDRWRATVTPDPRVRFLTFTKTKKGHPRHFSRLKNGTAMMFE